MIAPQCMSFSSSQNQPISWVKSLWCATKLAKTDVEFTFRWLTGMHSKEILNYMHEVLVLVSRCLC